MKRIAWVTAALLLATPALADDLDQETCRSATVKARVKNIRKAANALVARSLQPDASPEDWASELQTTLTETVTLAGLCPEKFKAACPFLDVPENVEVTVQTAPALLIQWMLGRHVFDGTTY
jgi:hypothetical protein